MNGTCGQTSSINADVEFAHYLNTAEVGGDSVMLNRKCATNYKAATLSLSELPIEPEAIVRQRLVQEVEITSLEIEKDPDRGSDPYNRTGQFCVVKISKDQ